MSPEEFESATRFIKERTGLVLTRDKMYLVENRLMPVVREQRLKSMSDLIAAVNAGDPAMQMAVVDAMMAKETAFFRDWKPFTHFRSVVLPNVRVSRGIKRSLRVLAAGVSTGQEAYSVAMTVHDLASSFSGWQVEVVGIDISPSAIAAAERAVYSQFDVQRGLPILSLLRHFAKQDEAWVLNKDVRSMVRFQTWNLMTDLFPLGRFDVVLCRNVLVYLDLKTKLDVLQKLARVIVDDGVLYLGVNETVTGIASSFRAVDAKLGIYASHRADRSGAMSLATKVDL